MIESNEKHDYVIHIASTTEDWWCGINFEGKFEYGGTYNPDKASRLFWDEVEKHLKEQGHYLKLQSQLTLKTKQLEVAVEALSGLVESATIEANEKGLGGYHEARLSDVRKALTFIADAGKGEV